MKAFRLMLVIAFVAAAMGMMPLTAKALAFASYESSINIQNLDAATSTISLIFYRQDGTVETTVSDTLTAGGAKTYFPLPGVATGFNGSVVVTSTTNVASISNIRGNAGMASGSYLSQSSGSTTVYLPVLMKNNGAALNNTWFNVQNAGSADANISVAYSDGKTASFSGLKPGAAHTFNNNTEDHGTVKVFAGTVTSNQPVVVTVVQETTKMIYASNGFKAGATNTVIPLVNYQPNKGLQTGVNIQNVGGSSTAVTVTYIGKNTLTNAAINCTETQTIAAGAVGTFGLYTFSSGTIPNGGSSTCPHNSGATYTVGFVGSAQATGNTASMPLAAVVNQQKYTQAASAYGSFDPATATGKFFAPMIMDRNGALQDLWTSINVMNVGTATTTVTCTFTGTSYTWSAEIAPGAGASALQTGQIGVKYVGAATCTGSTPATDKIIAIVNMQGSQATKDQMGTYEAINIAP